MLLYSVCNNLGAVEASCEQNTDILSNNSADKANVQANTLHLYTQTRQVLFFLTGHLVNVSPIVSLLIFVFGLYQLLREISGSCKFPTAFANVFVCLFVAGQVVYL